MRRNRRRLPRPLRKASRGVLIGLVALLATCAPKPVPPVHTPTIRPPAVADAGPLVDELSRAGVAADNQQAETSRRLTNAQREASSLKSSLERATGEADRLRRQKSAGEEELTRLWELLTEASQRNMFLEVELTSASTSLEAEKALRIEAQAMLLRLQSQVRQKDMEASLLRQSLDQSEAAADRLSDQVRKSFEEARQAKADVDQLKGRNSLKNKILLGTGILLILSLLANYLQLKRIL
jgi:chromosome segregation ATPase